MSRDLLEAFRGAVRAIVESVDVKPAQQLFERLSGPFQEQARRVRWRVSAQQIQCEFADLLSLEVLAPVRDWLAQQDHVDVLPDTWFGLPHLAALVRDPEAACMREIVVEQLISLREQPEPEAHELSAPRDITWAATLQIDDPDPSFGSVRGTPFDNFAPATFSVISELHDLCGVESLMLLLVGPYVLSRGPGPFLPPPQSATAIESPDWNKLPIFRTPTPAHWGWPLLDALAIEGTAVEQAINELSSASPNRSWWDEPCEDADDEDWATWLQVQWPRCQARYEELLVTARSSDSAVLFVKGEFGHGLGSDIPGERVLL